MITFFNNHKWIRRVAKYLYYIATLNFLFAVNPASSLIFDLLACSLGFGFIGFRIYKHWMNATGSSSSLIHKLLSRIIFSRNLFWLLVIYGVFEMQLKEYCHGLAMIMSLWSVLATIRTLFSFAISPSYNANTGYAGGGYANYSHSNVPGYSNYSSSSSYSRYEEEERERRKREEEEKARRKREEEERERFKRQCEAVRAARRNYERDNGNSNWHMF